MASKRVFYDGQTYSIQGSCTYYACRKSRDGTRLLHRHIWIAANGPIPDGFSIHHIDHDILNNELINLDAIPSKKHSRDHLLERIANGEMKPPSKDAIAKAALWHSSPAGLKWHSQHAKKQWANAIKKPNICECCGKAYGAFHADSRYCSNPCMQRSTYSRQFTEKKHCDYCGSEFLASKYRNVKHCSRTCAIKNRSKKTD